jgi:hypothetical protein
LTEKQRKAKINNIMSEMAGDKIQNIGSKTISKWILVKINKEKKYQLPDLLTHKPIRLIKKQIKEELKK